MYSPFDLCPSSVFAESPLSLLYEAACFVAVSSKALAGRWQTRHEGQFALRKLYHESDRCGQEHNFRTRSELPILTKALPNAVSG